jgi:hypothetical protein
MEAKKSSQQEIIFKPQYPLRIRLSVYLYPVGVLACLYFIFMAVVSRSIFPNIIFAFIFGFTVLSMPMIIFREISFGDEIRIKRYLLPARKIQYQDVTALTLRGLVAIHGGLPLSSVQNRPEFDRIIKRLSLQHKINLKK